MATTLSNTLRAQAQAMIEAAHKLIEAAEIVDGMGAVEMPSARVVHEDGATVWRHAEPVAPPAVTPRFRSGREAMLAILDDSPTPLSKREIKKRLAEIGIEISDNTIASTLSRGSEFVSAGAGQWKGAPRKRDGQQQEE